ncbi:helix-turn-helix transcriptional regulator [Dactylosporangium sp. NPDC000521]|uniref:helix-turn-helix transcriptional regulator n=1 Tax=Dactylosporangium sp. NPDC000521 TaxID=3363975 RepID=UPI0036CDDFC9
MNRTDRLYALVEELRAVAPRPRSARWLATRFEVSTRTIERDISALQQSGVPIWVSLGRTGGYVLDRTHTLPPLNMTPAEAVAIAVALHRLHGTPFHAPARTALHKLLAVMPAADVHRATEIAARIHLVHGADPGPAPVSPAVVEAFTTGRVLDIAYADRFGTTTRRHIEPVGYLGGPTGWYLLAWCRLRDAVRSFRVDRIHDVTPTPELTTPRPLPPDALDIPGKLITRVAIAA